MLLHAILPNCVLLAEVGLIREMRPESPTDAPDRGSPAPESAQSVTLRAATPADRDFLRAVFASTRSEELAALESHPKQIEAFIDMQFNIQQQTYSARYPTAQNSIILIDEQPVRRMLVDRTEEAIRLVDVALLGDYRNRGVGSFLIRGLLDEAAASHKPVHLSVHKFNPAARLYERLGFVRVADTGAQFKMEWRAERQTNGKA